jgi:hypothetical protein
VNIHNPNPDLTDPEEQARRDSFRDIASKVQNLATMYNVCTITNPGSVAPPYWAPLESDSAETRVELERRIRALFSRTDPALNGLHNAHVIRAWAVKNLGQDRAELTRKMREEAAATGAHVDPNDISHSRTR